MRLPFSLYIDELFLLLKESGIGCHVGLTYAGAFGYADDIALVAPSLSSLKQHIPLLSGRSGKLRKTIPEIAVIGARSGTRVSGRPPPPGKF